MGLRGESAVWASKGNMYCRLEGGNLYCRLEGGTLYCRLVEGNLYCRREEEGICTMSLKGEYAVWA